MENKIDGDYYNSTFLVIKSKTSLLVPMMRDTLLCIQQNDNVTAHCINTKTYSSLEQSRIVCGLKIFNNQI